MAKFARKVKVTKTEAYVLAVEDWLASEAITSFAVTDEEGTGLLAIGGVEIDGYKLKVLVTGLSIGTQELRFSFTTATRSNCSDNTISVISIDD